MDRTERLLSGVATLTVAEGEDGMRLDRWFAVHYPGLPFGRLQKLIRTGQVRVDKGRAQTNTRLEAGQQIRVPPIEAAPKSPPQPRYNAEDAAFLRDLILYEDKDVYVFNKPHGLAVQGGSGTKRHIDGMLKSLPNRDGETPRLVHRLDRDTSGCLLVARTRAAATHFGKVFRSRSARKIYWAVTVGVPSPRQGKASCFLVKQPTRDGEQMVVAEHGDDGAQHSISYFSVTDQAGDRFAWVTLKPVTGRTHQLRVHMNLLGTPDPRRPALFRPRGLRAARGIRRGPAPACPPPVAAAARRQAARRLGAAAAAHAKDLRRARLRRRPLRRPEHRPGRRLMRLIVFDLDGTLVDSGAHIGATMTAAFAEEGLPRRVPKRSRGIIGLSLETALMQLSGRRGPALDRLAATYRRLYHQSIAHAGTRTAV